MITCRCFIEQLDDLVTRCLAPDEQAAAEDHLRACPPCGVLMETYEITIRLTRGLGYVGGVNTQRPAPKSEH